jgi:hypothetical protein
MPKEKTKVKLKKENKKINAQLLRAKARNSASKFKIETKKALSTALIAAFGFVIALEWRELIQELLIKLTSTSPIQGKLISAIIITTIAVIGIIITTKFLSQE